MEINHLMNNFQLVVMDLKNSITIFFKLNFPIFFQHGHRVYDGKITIHEYIKFCM